MAHLRHRIGRSITGDNIGFWIGDKGGYRIAHRFGHLVRLDEHKLKIARYVFDRHGPKVVFLGRFVSILRTYAAFLAGTSKMRWRRFLPANASGAVVWASIYTLASYVAGDTLSRLSGTIDLVVGGVALAAVATVLLFIRRGTNKIGTLAEAAYPGALK